MNILTELREEAAAQPEGSRAKRLLTWAEIHFSDSAERIMELESDLELESAEGEKLRECLCQVKAMLELIGVYARDVAFRMPTDTFAKDFSPFINLMGAQGDADYMKGDLACRHVDLREKKPKAAKAKAST